ncbi:MAG TPA: BrnT family toxin, partial [Longimicrobium sp.]
MSLNFDWDRRKALSNAAKHGVTFVEASTAFTDPLSVTVHDPLHSGYEERLVLFGQANTGRLLAVMFTEHGNTLRIISARLMSSRERRQFKEGG